MLRSIRADAGRSGESEVPVVLTNHPKEIRSFSAIEQFVSEVSESEDIRFITLTELVRKLLANELPIRRSQTSA
jgi:hypothetical protein